MQASARLSSSAASKKVIAGVSSPITRSCYRTSRGKAHAAPLSAQEPPPKGQKRITKQERRVRIVEFVDKFRASNDGKFPSITNARQQVGGSYYTVRVILQELKYNHAKLPLGNAKAAPLQGTVEVAEHSGPKDEAMVAQLKGTPEFAEHSRPKDDSVKSPYNCDSLKSSKEIQDVDDMLISQKDDATSTGIVEKTETWKSVGSSHHNVETEAAKHDLNTSETLKTADDPTLSDQTESESMKVITNKSYVSLGVEAQSDPGNQQRNTEASKLALENTEKILNASESSVSDQSGSDKVVKANIHDREHNPKHEPEESPSTGLFGSLKSFAYGFRNFWKKL
ncbi:hypothetical protein SEVIR_1G252200v4 [Setaria viridis]|uniref:AT3G52170-like helix-turn-helix domain-containing protein n=1 Tax=Setaria viridis TaxID=4556 RepID=A0A4U6WPB1_SETVI|nr:uncharacterized protein LOC117863741 [Setaria viridis]TKW40537.1 hypothetical protein SEVIR_1G252200v2 [Setaria viridis]